MKVFRDFDEIYANGIQEENGRYVCSVCGKSYKRDNFAAKHIAVRNCHTTKEVFRDTLSEDWFTRIYDNLAAIAGFRRFRNIDKFRKSPSYSQIAKFYLYCLSNGIRNPLHYLEFIIGTSSPRNPFMALSWGKAESMLQKYYAHRQHNGSSDQERFLNGNRERLMSDNDFAIRSLEKGEITFNYLFDHRDAEEFVNGLSDFESTRFNNFLEVLND